MAGLLAAPPPRSTNGEIGALAKAGEASGTISAADTAVGRGAALSAAPACGAAARSTTGPVRRAPVVSTPVNAVSTVSANVPRSVAVTTRRRATRRTGRSFLHVGIVPGEIERISRGLGRARLLERRAKQNEGLDEHARIRGPVNG